VAVCDFATRVTTGRLAVEQRPDERVGGAAPRPGGSRRRPQGRVAQIELSRRAGEELGVLGVGARPAALDEADAELVEVARDGELVRDGEVEPLLLGAIAQRGVVDVQVGHRLASSVVSSWSFHRALLHVTLVLTSFPAARRSTLRGGAPTNKKTPRGVGGLRDEECSSRYSIMRAAVAAYIGITGLTLPKVMADSTGCPHCGSGVPLGGTRIPPPVKVRLALPLP
jgi:hypothetical protein